jgi:hypothetical protein
VKCGECPNQAFLPVDDKITLDHLQGRHVVGVYPLLTDETCWFLAADFDKASWTDDVAAFTETSRAHGLPAAVERSRSGNGAHVWFFFSAPVAASPGGNSTSMAHSKPSAVPRPPMKTGRRRKTNQPRKTRLDRLVEEAIVDCYNESEQVAGLYTMIEDNLALPFETMILGVPPSASYDHRQRQGRDTTRARRPEHLRAACD